jgi:protein-disulfide isomerase
VGSLRSAPPAPVGPDDHVRGEPDAPLVVVYADFECPHCAQLVVRLAQLTVREAFRHFPVASKHPRALAAAHAAEAAGLQGRFWEMHDSLFSDQGRIEDPHLWRRAEQLGLDLERFEADRRSDPVAARVREQFRGGVRAGVASTPALWIGGELRDRAGALAALDRL